MICVTHLTKSSHKDFAANVAGSMGAFSSCDTLLHLSRARGEKRALLRVVSRETGEKELPMEMTEQGLWRIAPDAEEEAWMSPERRALIAALRVQSPQGPKALSQLTGIPHGSCRVMLSKMAKAGHLQRVRGGYILPEASTVNSCTDNTDNTTAVADTGPQPDGDQDAGLAPIISLADFVTTRAQANDDDGVVH